MKSVVLNDTAREIEFKPNELFGKYMALLQSDLKNHFSRKDALRPAVCPGCLSAQGFPAFEKFGFVYLECLVCKTVYMSPHPLDTQVKSHYLNAASSRFWEEKLAASTDDARKEKIYLPRLQWIKDLAAEFLPRAEVIADFCNKNKNYVLDFLQDQSFKQKIIVNPYFSAEREPLAARSGQIVSDLIQVENLPQNADLVTVFEAIDYTSDVEALFKTIHGLLVKGGLCFVTTISISGFDLQVLWDNSKSIFPLDRMNVFSSDGLMRLFGRHGFEVIEYSTPGLLDLDIVRNVVQENKKIPVPRFVQTLLDKNDLQLFKDFQEFLQINRLSSFVRVVLQKK